MSIKKSLWMLLLLRGIDSEHKKRKLKIKKRKPKNWIEPE